MTRAERPSGDEDGRDPARKLTSEEVRALLAVEGAVRPSRGGLAWRRGRVLIVPVGLVSLAAEALLGSAAPWVIMGGILAAIAWSARPLFQRSDWT